MNQEELISYFEKKREDFPILTRKINNQNLVYVDNGATTQKPQRVINKIVDFYQQHCSNVHRGIHSLSEESTEMFEEVRKKIANFINADEKEVVFTTGTTQSINIITNGIKNQIKENDEIIVTALEHHANLVPWQELVKKTNAKLKVIPINNNYEIDLEEVKKNITNKTKILAFSHISNVTGVINPIEELIEIAKQNNILTVVDAAQSVPHKKIDVKMLDCDFLVFSAHKMCGPSGVGILYGRFKELDKLEPMNFGGSMIYEVSYENSTYNKTPFKFEAGTPNIEGVIGFGAAIDYLNDVGMENIEKYEKILSDYMYEKIIKIDDLKLFASKNKENRSSVFSFEIKGIHPHDMSAILDKKGIAIRAGHHCAMPLMKELNTCATSRISLYFYNTKDDVDKIIKALKEAKEDFKSGKFLL